MWLSTSGGSPRPSSAAFYSAAAQRCDAPARVVDRFTNPEGYISDTATTVAREDIRTATGTTGDPKAVCFSHRQIVLHTLAVLAGGGSTAHGQCFRHGDVYMPMTPMFHVHA
jgi:fatty-acyl-CoA synthase